MRKFLATYSVFVWVALLWAGVNIDGFYESNLLLNGRLRWTLEEPHNCLELRFRGSPMHNLEGFLKISAQTDRFFNNNAAERYRLYDMVEAHTKFRWDKGLEIVAFARENRFWFPQGLMELVSQWVVNDGGNAQGIRVDFWNLWKFYGVAIHSDYSQSGGEDANILRLNLPLAGDKIRISSTLARKDWEGGSQNFNTVVSVDGYAALGRLVPFLSKFGTIGCAAEFARSRIPEPIDSVDNTAFRAEIRELRVGDFGFRLGYRDIGANFRSYLSSDYDQGQKFNEKGFNVNASYFFPTKAVNITTSYDEYWAPQTRTFPPSRANPLHRFQEWYNELYVEFIHDIKYKVYYKYYRGWDQNYDAYKVYPTLFNEVSFEDYFAKVKLQFRWKDIDAPYEIYAFGVEINTNLTKNLKLYMRAVNVNEIAESRQTVFAQLQYHAFSNTEFFLEFGNPYDSDGDLTNDDDFVNVNSSAGIARQIRAIVKIYF